MLTFVKKIIKKIKYLFNFLSRIYNYNVLPNFKTLPPKMLIIAVTSQCNFRCQMCDVWRRGIRKEQELKFSDWQKMMKDPIFSSIEALNITGGEPFLHPELPKLINLYLESMPRLRDLSISTNGFFTQKIVSLVKDLAPIAEKRGIKLIISVSMDEIGEAHDSLRGFVGAFQKVEETILELKNLQKKYDLFFMVNCVISKKNLYEVKKIREWCETRNIPLRLTLVGFFDTGFISNADKKSELDFTKEDKNFLLETLKSLSFRDRNNFASYYFYDMLHLYKNKSRRTIPCPFIIDGFNIDCLGEVRYCFRNKEIGNFLENFSISEIYYKPENLIFRAQIKKKICPQCNATCHCEVETENEFLKLFWFSLTGRRPWW